MLIMLLEKRTSPFIASQARRTKMARSSEETSYTAAQIRTWSLSTPNSRRNLRRGSPKSRRLTSHNQSWKISRDRPRGTHHLIRVHHLQLDLPWVRRMIGRALPSSRSPSRHTKACLYQQADRASTKELSCSATRTSILPLLSTTLGLAINSDAKMI